MSHEVGEKLRNIGVSTVERLLVKHKKKLKNRGTCGTKSGPPLKKRVAIPTHAECAIRRPEHSVTFTKGRTGRKNDNCRVEQKNYGTVRKTAGYSRYSGDRGYRHRGPSTPPRTSRPTSFTPV